MAVEPVLATGPRSIRGMERGRQVGYLFALLTAVCWATSPILIREGLKGLDSAVWGITIGMAAAAIINVIWVAVRRPTPGIRFWRDEGGWASARAPFAFMLLAGAVSGVGAVARGVAIKLAPVVVVLPLAQTTSFFTPVLAPLLLGRHVEHVPPRLLLGAFLVVGGSALVIVGLNV
jgi:drug/metabolite transporter (DMT)-like permease